MSTHSTHEVYATAALLPVFSNAANVVGNTPDTFASRATASPVDWVSASVVSGASFTGLPSNPTERAWHRFTSWDAPILLSSAKASGIVVDVMIDDVSGDAADDVIRLTFSSAAHAEILDGAAFAGLEIDISWLDNEAKIYRARLLWDATVVRGRRYTSSVIAPSPLVRL